MPKFGELLRRLRGERSQREVAAELRMPITTLSTLENQDAAPRGPVLRRLCEHYSVPPTYFYPGGPVEMRPSDLAREWLAQVRQNTTAKDTIATYASPDFPEGLKNQLAEKIRQRKHANAANLKQDA
jgi:transcriptional regulator with XRE-family HTH domain